MLVVTECHVGYTNVWIFLFFSFLLVQCFPKWLLLQGLSLKAL